MAIWDKSAEVVARVNKTSIASQHSNDLLIGCAERRATPREFVAVMRSEDFSTNFSRFATAFFGREPKCVLDGSWIAISRTHLCPPPLQHLPDDGHRTQNLFRCRRAFQFDHSEEPREESSQVCVSPFQVEVFRTDEIVRVSEILRQIFPASCR